MNTTNPTISIIVPIYNTGAFLRECIDSIVGQSYSDYELILVDDGSTDECSIIEEHYAEKYDNIMILHSNSGCVSSARNMGIEHAKGKYILFVDSDDYLKPDCLKILHETITKFPEADFVQAPFSVLAKSNITPRSKRFETLDKYANRIWNGIDYLTMMTFTITYPWNSLIRRSFLENAQLRFNPNLTAQEDLLFIVEIFINGAKGILIKEPTYVYRFGRDGSLTSIKSNLTPNEIAKRKKLLRSMIDCSKCLKELIPVAPQIKDLLLKEISLNLTGCIGGCSYLFPYKEIFKHLTNVFPKIPISGSIERKLLATLYNLNHTLALYVRRYFS